jgi:hypothetical protein
MSNLSGSGTIDVLDPTPEEIADRQVIEDRKKDAMTKLRSERDPLLHQTDKYVIGDYPIDDETFKKWKNYRQYLRDLPAMSSPDLDEDGNLTGVEWDIEKATEKAAQAKAKAEALAEALAEDELVVSGLSGEALAEAIAEAEAL